MGSFMKWATKWLAKLLPPVGGFVVLCHELYLAVGAFTRKEAQPLLTFAQWMLTTSQPTVTNAYTEARTKGSEIAAQTGISRTALLAIAVGVFIAWWWTKRTDSTKAKLATVKNKDSKK